jgi:hypothetical protein
MRSSFSAYAVLPIAITAVASSLVAATPGWASSRDIHSRTIPRDGDTEIDLHSCKVRASASSGRWNVTNVPKLSVAEAGQERVTFPILKRMTL